MVLIVAAALTVVAVQLKPAQDNNVRVEKMRNILTAANIESTVENAAELFNKFINETKVVNAQGEAITGVDAFDIDLKKESEKSTEKRNLPIYICHTEKGDTLYIFPLLGKGLWGPIWGYISLSSNLSEIKGAMFDHKGETPGLGAEIDTREFQQQFFGKSIFDTTGKFVSVKVMKGGAPDDDLNAVDAISGGTITSHGLQDMIEHSLQQYNAFFEIHKKK
jgi:Na+-transporting NADH:ubiquinone oxidoreductase subunit C